MISFFSWLAGTRPGRITVAVLAAFAAFFYAVFKAFSAGQAAEKEKHDKAALGAVKQKVESDEAVNRLSPSDRRQRLREWGRD